jgi:hypothetical protein
MIPSKGQARTDRDEFPSVEVHDYQPPVEAEGVSVEFRLVYRGPLGSGNQCRKDEKNAIRRVFHRQLAELWKQHAGLRGLSPSGSDPRLPVTRHKKEANFRIPNKNGDQYNFLYLIGEGHGISCSLDVLFLRRESAGGLVKHGGDLDNRIKILFDAMRMPRSNEELPDTPPSEDENPFFCVLEDDQFIDKITVTTDRILTPLDSRIGERENDAFLIIGVKTIMFDALKADWWVTTDR